MKKLFSIFATFAMLCAVGCEEQGGGDDIDPNDKTEQPDDKPNEEIPENIFFGLDKESVTISPDGGSVDVIVYSNYKWEISGKSDWCTPSVTSGEANEDGQKVSFSADVAYDNREATFWFRCADEKIKFTVSQSFKEVFIADENKTFSVPAEGGVAVLNYQATVKCEVIIPEEAKSWITIAPADATRGLVAESIKLNIAKNTFYTKGRSAVIKVVAKSNDELYAEYTIIQDSKRCIIEYISNDGKVVKSYDSSAFDASIISNTYNNGIGVIEFDKPITSIGEDAFRGCSSLTSVTIPDSVTSIGYMAFAYCTLTSVAIPDSVTSIGEGAFSSCYWLTSVTIPDSVTSIGESAFYDCYSLTSVTIGDSVTSIGKAAFYECFSLTSVTIGDSVTSIGDYAFAYCSKLASITIPDSVTSIGEWAFYNCESLTSVTIGDSVTLIGSYAFVGCTSLTSVYCKPTTPPTGGSYMFKSNASGRKIYVPTKSVDAYKRTSYWSDYESYIYGYDF